MENDWALFAHMMMIEGRYLSHHLKVKTAHPYVMPVMLYRELAFSCEALLQMVCHAQGSRLDIRICQTEHVTHVMIPVPPVVQ